jgi:hypothetical protein
MRQQNRLVLEYLYRDLVALRAGLSAPSRSTRM